MENNRGFNLTIEQPIIERAAQSDPVAIEQIYRQLANPCYSLAYRMLGDQGYAEDVVQNAFIKMIRSLKQFDFKGSFAGWVRKIVVNEAISKLRTNKHWQTLESDMSMTLDQLEHSGSYSMFDVDWALAARDLDNLLAQLPERTRTVMLLYEVEGYSHAQIGELFELSESFSKVTLSRGYQALRKLIETSTVKANETSN